MLSTASPSVLMGKIQCFHLAIERLLISGHRVLVGEGIGIFQFQSRYRAASHFREEAGAVWHRHRRQSFNLVIERLLISGTRGSLPSASPISFPSRYRAASHFRQRCRLPHWKYRRFHLVIERLLISGKQELLSERDALEFQSRYRAASHFRSPEQRKKATEVQFQSRYRAASHFRRKGNFGIQWLVPSFQSRYRAASHFRVVGMTLLIAVPVPVSISLSSGFSFQVHLR